MRKEACRCRGEVPPHFYSQVCGNVKWNVTVKIQSAYTQRLTKPKKDTSVRGGT
jgi:hypothetical protein